MAIAQNRGGDMQEINQLLHKNKIDPTSFEKSVSDGMGEYSFEKKLRFLKPCLEVEMSNLSVSDFFNSAFDQSMQESCTTNKVVDGLTLIHQQTYDTAENGKCVIKITEISPQPCTVFQKISNRFLHKEGIASFEQISYKNPGQRCIDVKMSRSSFQFQGATVHGAYCRICVDESSKNGIRISMFMETDIDGIMSGILTPILRRKIINDFEKWLQVVQSCVIASKTNLKK